MSNARTGENDHGTVCRGSFGHWRDLEHRDGHHGDTRSVAGEQHREGTDPAAPNLAEGATGTFWDEDVAIAKSNAAPAPVTLNFLKDDGSVVTQTSTVAPTSRVTVHVDDVAGLESATSSAEITSEDGLPLAIARTMTWDASAYAAHTSTAVTQAATRWYFAEGAQGLFHTFVLLENPQTTPTTVTVTFLREMNSPSCGRSRWARAAVRRSRPSTFPSSKVTRSAWS